MVFHRDAMSPSASSQLTRLNLRLTLPADALERMEHAIGVIDAIEIVIHLGAKRAACEGMRRIAGKLLGGAVAHLHDPAAGVRTVVSACAANNAQPGLLRSRFSVAVDLPSDPKRIADHAVARRPVRRLQRHDHVAAVRQALRTRDPLLRRWPLREPSKSREELRSREQAGRRP